MPAANTPEWLSYVQAFGPPLTALFAIVAAFVNANGMVRAQKHAQDRTETREQARRSHVDRAVRQQIYSYLLRFADVFSTLISDPLWDYPVAHYYERFSRRIMEVDVASAFSETEFAALFLAQRQLEGTTLGILKYYRDELGARGSKPVKAGERGVAIIQLELLMDILTLRATFLKLGESDLAAQVAGELSQVDAELIVATAQRLEINVGGEIDFVRAELATIAAHNHQSSSDRRPHRK